MKKLFGIGNRAENTEYNEEEYYSEESVGEEYYSDDQYGEEYYAEEEYCSDDQIEEEYYADEEGEGEEYYSDEETGEEYYSDEETGEEYYSDEQMEDEYYADEQNEAEYYSDEQSGEEYYSDEYEEEYYEEEYYEEDWEDSASLGFIDKVKHVIANMDIVDRVVACTGIGVLILALITGTVFASNRLVAEQVNSFATVGNQLDGITVIGGDGLLAVADAQIARQEAALMLEEEPEIESEGYDEEEYSNEVTVSLNMTSIKKDLKIKFVNKKTGKLIPNVPFEVEVTDPKGKTTNWVDDDKDGIIYKTDIAHGEYSVAMVSLEGYEDYKISTASKAVKVKENLDYQKVDVSDEIKKESEVDASKEDTAQNELEVESSLQDTVAWVESTKTPISENYVEVSKATIDEPKVARFDNFMKLVGSYGEEVSIEGAKPLEATGSVTLSAITKGFPENVTYSWELTGDGATLDKKDGKDVTLTANNTSTEEKSVTVTVTATATTTEQDVSGNNISKEYRDSIPVTITIAKGKSQETAPTITISPAAPSVEKGKTVTLTAKVDNVDTVVAWSSSDTTVATVDTNGVVTGVTVGKAKITATYTPEGGTAVTATCEVTVTEPVAKVTITLDKTKDTIAVNGKLELAATLTGNAVDTTKITWKSADESIATVKGDNAKATVTGVKAGEVKITATYTENGENVTAECVVTVTNTEAAIKLNKTSETILSGNTLELIPTITGNDTTNNKIVWTSSDEKIATVTGDNTKATVTGVKAGEVTITASYTENGKKVEATCKVTVKANPAQDTTTALKDKSGNQIYVKNAQGQYVAATYSDYFKANQKFYLKQQGYKYTGWQTIDGRVYYFDANGNKVTGAQVIQGAQYSFDANGMMVSSNGILGIDVSKWNGSIDWNAVKNSGVSYVIIRCGYRGSSQGSLIEDPKYKTNIQGATAAGLKVGVYFFSQAINEIEAVEEASMVLSLVKGYKLSYPIFLDVEPSGGRGDNIDKTTRTAVCKAFCQTIKNSGYTAGIYANKTWLNKYIDTNQLSAYRIWLAQYAAQPTYAGRYDIWQYSSKGKISGIKGDVDLNLSYMGY